MSFEEILAGKTAHCEKVLCEMLPDADKLQGSDRFAEVVVRAMQYSVMAGGKRPAGCTAAGRNWPLRLWLRWR